MLDTNVVVSGLLWGGHSRRLLELALSNTIALYSSPLLVDELSQTLHYAKLAKRITGLQTTALALVAYYSAMVTRWQTPQSKPSLPTWDKRFTRAPSNRPRPWARCTRQKFKSGGRSSRRRASSRNRRRCLLLIV